MTGKIRQPKRQIVIVGTTSSSHFITLKLGKAACERFLSSANVNTLTWFKKNALLYTQAEIVAEKYLKGRSLPATRESSAGRSSAAGTVADRDGKPHPEAATFVKPLSVNSQHFDVYIKSQPPTPGAQTPQRTPSIKLSFGKPKASPSAPSSVLSNTEEDGTTPTGSSKKRKRDGVSVEPHAIVPPKIKGPQLLRLVTKHAPSTAKNSAKSAAVTPGIKLKTRGKIPKRPTGVGYDSELEDREVDPVVLEAFVLRMLPGDDCDYIRDSIANGTVGVSILQKGADIRMRFLDVLGRRGILNVRGRQYAFTVVDLPTITEGMKSWDRKNFIKSVDISQMCLVLGRCSTDEEARNYPLPPDVNPKNYQYAHGLTAPMKNVCKRRFEKTARARLDDIESIERKVSALLEADTKASHVTHQILDYDPRERQDSSAEEYDSDDDAEGDEEDSYLVSQNGVADTTDFTQTPEDNGYGDDELRALEAMFEQGDAPGDTPATAAPATAISLQTGTEPSSSTAPSPVQLTTATSAELSADMSMAEADDDNDDNDDGPDNDADADADNDDDASDQEASDEKAETLAKIKEAEDKIAQQREQLRKTTNGIFKKKFAKKIQDLESDIRMMKRHAGLVSGRGQGGDGGEGESEEE